MLSAFSAEKLQKFIYREDKKWISHDYNKKKWPRTQDLLNSFILNSAALIAKDQFILKKEIDCVKNLTQLNVEIIQVLT